MREHRGPLAGLYWSGVIAPECAQARGTLAHGDGVGAEGGARLQGSSLRPVGRTVSLSFATCLDLGHALREIVARREAAARRGRGTDEDEPVLAGLAVVGCQGWACRWTSWVLQGKGHEGALAVEGPADGGEQGVDHGSSPVKAMPMSITSTSRATRYSVSAWPRAASAKAGHERLECRVSTARAPPSRRQEDEVSLAGGAAESLHERVVHVGERWAIGRRPRSARLRRRAVRGWCAACARSPARAGAGEAAVDRLHVREQLGARRKGEPGWADRLPRARRRCRRPSSVPRCARRAAARC